MDEYLLSANVDLHRDDLLREAEQDRIGAPLHESHAWRHRVGEAFIRLGQRMAEEPPDEPHPRTA